MDSTLHRIEALPGEGRYAVTFQRADGSEQTAVVQVGEGSLDVAEASLPSGWTREGEAFAPTAATVLAFEAARRLGPSAGALRDLDGGWDVSLGNVVLDAAGVPTCIAHGPLEERDAAWICAECGAGALLG